MLLSFVRASEKGPLIYCVILKVDSTLYLLDRQDIRLRSHNGSYLNNNVFFLCFFYSRVAQMYREKLATLAARALQQYGLQVQCYSTSFHLNLLLGCSVLLGVLCVFMCMSGCLAEMVYHLPVTYLIHYILIWHSSQTEDFSVSCRECLE